MKSEHRSPLRISCSGSYWGSIGFQSCCRLLRNCSPHSRHFRYNLHWALHLKLLPIISLSKPCTDSQHLQPRRQQKRRPWRALSSSSSWRSPSPPQVAWRSYAWAEILGEWHDMELIVEGKLPILKTLEKGSHPSHSLRRSAPSSSDCPPRPGFSGAGFPRCCHLASLPFLEEFERRLEVSGTWWGDRAHGRMRTRVLQRFVRRACVVVLSLLHQSRLHHLRWNHFGFLVEVSIRRSWRCIYSFAIVVIKVRCLNIITVLVFKSNSYFCNKGKGKYLNLL